MPFLAERDPRYVQGRALIRAKKYDVGIQCLCELLEAMVQKFGENHLESAPVLFEYGSALLLQAESSANLFGDAVDDAAQEKENASMTGVEKAQRAVAAASSTAEDLEIAWEVLEVARVICSEHLENTDVALLLSRIHLRLGDHGLDNGNIANALADYTACLEVRTRILDLSDRRLADAHAALAVAHLYDSVKKQSIAEATASRSKALVHYSQAEETITRRIVSLAQSLVATGFGAQVAAALPPALKGALPSSTADVSVGDSKSGDVSLIAADDWYATVMQDQVARGGAATLNTKPEKELFELLDVVGQLREKQRDTKKLNKDAAAQGVTSASNAAQSMFGNNGFDKSTLGTDAGALSSTSSSSSKQGALGTSAIGESTLENVAVQQIIPRKDRKRKSITPTVVAPSATAAAPEAGALVENKRLKSDA